MSTKHDERLSSLDDGISWVVFLDNHAVWARTGCSRVSIRQIVKSQPDLEVCGKMFITQQRVQQILLGHLFADGLLRGGEEGGGD
jgi:hypothetical protein